MGTVYSEFSRPCLAESQNVSTNAQRFFIPDRRKYSNTVSYDGYLRLETKCEKSITYSKTRGKGNNSDDHCNVERAFTLLRRACINRGPGACTIIDRANGKNAGFNYNSHERIDPTKAVGARCSMRSDPLEI